MKVAVAQLSSSTDKNENLKKAKSYMKKAKEKGANIIVLPELFMVYTPSSSNLKPADYAEPLDGPFVSGLVEAARQYKIQVICGIFESSPSDKQRAFNTTVFIDKLGNLLHDYRKTHLYDAFNFKESDTIIPGVEKNPVIKTEYGTIGIMVCYEIRFPEISRELALEGVDFLFIPSGWVEGYMKEDHWQTILRARAIENTTYIFASNQVGNIFTGRSMIVDPMGVVLADAGEEEALLIYEIDHDRIKRVRKKLPSVTDRRPELYKIL